MLIMCADCFLDSSDFQLQFFIIFYSQYLILKQVEETPPVEMENVGPTEQEEQEDMIVDPGQCDLSCGI